MKPFKFIAFALGMSLISNQSIAKMMQSEDDLKSAVNGFSEVANAVNDSNPVTPPCNSDRSTTDPMLISDSFVKNLNCRTLTKDNVFSSLQDDAFSDDRNLTKLNWSSGELGQCWALASAQRRIFYLTRFNVPGAGDPTKNGSLGDFLKMIAKDKESKVIQIEDGHLKTFNAPAEQKSRFAEALDLGNAFDAFKQTIEANQKGLFFRLQNLGLIFGDMIKDPEENTKMFRELLKMVNRGERPLLIMRQKAMSQHVIMVKHVEKIADNNYLFSSYDSNAPVFNSWKYRFKDGQFYFVLDGQDFGPLGMVMPKDDDMDRIREISYQYYQNLCGKNGNGR